MFFMTSSGMFLLLLHGKTLFTKQVYRHNLTVPLPLIKVNDPDDLLYLRSHTVAYLWSADQADSQH